MPGKDLTTMDPISLRVSSWKFYAPLSSGHSFLGIPEIIYSAIVKLLHICLASAATKIIRRACDY